VSSDCSQQGSGWGLPAGHREFTTETVTDLAIPLGQPSPTSIPDRPWARVWGGSWLESVCFGSLLGLVPPGGSSGGWGWVGRSLVGRGRHRERTDRCCTCKHRRGAFIGGSGQWGGYEQELIRPGPGGLTWLASLASVGCIVD
jgi:hypothetical protein